MTTNQTVEEELSAEDEQVYRRVECPVCHARPGMACWQVGSHHARERVHSIRRLRAIGAFGLQMTAQS